MGAATTTDSSEDSPAFRVGIAFGLQVIEGPLPAGRFDLLVQAIVTEQETIRPDRNSQAR